MHIRGVDTLHTDDIKAWVRAHYGLVDRVEWIDDSSANLIFSSESSAREAIVALSSTLGPDSPPLKPDETIPAKPFEGKPEISLHIRVALESDKKVAGAALRSRYYLLHPEHDPEERRRRGRYRERDYGSRNGHGRRRRDSDERDAPFEASMYDDAPQTSRSRRGDSRDRSISRPRLENRGKELFAGHRRGRNRSASPRRERDDDGDQSMADERASSAHNRHQARSIKDRISSSNHSKELFPTKSTGSGRGGQLDKLESAIGSAHLKDEDRPTYAADPGGFSIKGSAKQRSDAPGFSIRGAAQNARELFPDKLGTGNVNEGKELLTKKPARRRAEDLFG